MAIFDGSTQNAIISNAVDTEKTRIKFVLNDAYEDFTGISRYLIDSRTSGSGYLGTNSTNSNVFANGTIVKINGSDVSSLSSSNAVAGVEIELALNASNNNGTYTLFSKNDNSEYNRINTNTIEVWNNANDTILHSFDISSPSQAVINDSVGGATLTLEGFTFPEGPTITGPDSTTDGTNTVETGTLLDTVTIQSLISGSYEAIQSIDTQVPAQLEYIANSGVNDCVPGTPVAGVPLEATITAPGITPYVVQQKVDDGVNPPTTRDITLNAPATHDVIHTMIASANTIDDQSIFGTSWIDVEDNMQAYVPKVVDGVNFTWAADGTFTTDQDKTVVVRVPYFAPSTGQYGCIDFTVQGSTIISSGMITPMIEPMISNMIEDM